MTGRVNIDLEASGIRVNYCCPQCGVKSYTKWLRKKGLRFATEPQNWPDVFQLTEKPGPLFVKLELAQFLIDSKAAPFVLASEDDLDPW